MRNLRTAGIRSDTLAATTAEKIDLLQNAVERVIRGKPEAVRLAIVTLLAGGHLLVEDVPGVGKTTLARALARALDCSFQRIQFTSDLLPSDVIGLSIYNQHDSHFEWKPGPIFANVVLADEINRTTPKTQSALLEAMAERHVTVEGVTHALPQPFIVLATQNPIEHHGTYPLPESQLDRFMLRLRIGYPGIADEKQILRDREHAEPLDEMEPVMSAEDILQLNNDGSRDALFTSNGPGNTLTVNALIQQPDGKLLVGFPVSEHGLSDIAKLNAIQRQAIGRLNLDGTTDTSFTSPFLRPGFSSNVVTTRPQ